MITIRALAASRRWLIRFGAVLCLALMAGTAHAECYAGPSDFIPLSFGGMTIDSSVPDGSTIGTPAHWQYHLTCKKRAGGQADGVQVNFTPDRGLVPGTDMWATPLSGVGARVRVNGEVVSANRSYAFSHPGDGSTETFDMSLELVKLGPVRPSHFDAYIFQLIAVDSGGAHIIGDEHIVDTMFQGTACTVMQDSRQKIVNMGTWTVPDFKGAGSMVGKQRLTLSLRCDMIGNPNPTPLSISLDGSTVAGHDDLLQVTGSPAATGIGIQLSNAGTGSVYPFNQWIRLNNSVPAGFYDINMNAAYYQYSDHVSAGDANGIVTFRIDMR
jgi:type 1 fimbria pilin